MRISEDRQQDEGVVKQTGLEHELSMCLAARRRTPPTSCYTPRPARPTRGGLPGRLAPVHAPSGSIE